MLNRELKKKLSQNLSKAFFGLLALLILVFIVGYFFKPELLSICNYLYQKFGILGLSGIVFLCDFFFSIIPPSPVLIIIEESSANAIRDVVIVSFFSALGAAAIWLVGKISLSFSYPRILKKIDSLFSSFSSNRPYTVMGIAALFPLPWGVMAFLFGRYNLPVHIIFICWPLRAARFFIYFFAMRGVLDLVEYIKL
ncbi:MAG: hypothetical protein AB8E15_02050 [Bdellovibrionales bacterium]